MSENTTNTQESSKGIYKLWVDMQQKLMDTWNDALESFKKTPVGKNMDAVWSKWQESINDMLERQKEWAEKWREKLPGNLQDVPLTPAEWVEQMKTVGDYLASLQEQLRSNWSALLERLHLSGAAEFASDETERFVNFWQEEIKRLMEIQSEWGKQIESAWTAMLENLDPGKMAKDSSEEVQHLYQKGYEETKRIINMQIEWGRKVEESWSEALNNLEPSKLPGELSEEARQFFQKWYDDARELMEKQVEWARRVESDWAELLKNPDPAKWMEYSSQEMQRFFGRWQHSEESAVEAEEAIEVVGPADEPEPAVATGTVEAKPTEETEE